MWCGALYAGRQYQVLGRGRLDPIACVLWGSQINWVLLV